LAHIGPREVVVLSEQEIVGRSFDANVTASMALQAKTIKLSTSDLIGG
jgi:hypothetical protein